MTALHWIDPFDDTSPFPDAEMALQEPDGLLAVGGSLSPRRLLSAYSQGIFPWYSEGQPILWWSPNPRSVLFPPRLRISRSLRKRLRRGEYRVTFDQAFDQVIARCAEPRAGQDGTWITAEMAEAYSRLHHLGTAHSVETWCENELVGGLYGVGIGRVFFGESMFSRRADASKVAFAHLVRHLEQWGFHLVDCQVKSAHLDSLGAEDMPRREFLNHLRQWAREPAPVPAWQPVPLEF